MTSTTNPVHPSDPRAADPLALDTLASFRPDVDEPTIATRPDRPVGALSDFVVDELGLANQAIREGRLSADDLFHMVESRARAVAANQVSDLLAPDHRMARRTASLDLAWCERALSIAFTDRHADYRRRRASTAYFQLAQRLAKGRRHPLLSWPDIASHHPVRDPRSFLEPGSARNQEVFMYRVQWAIDSAYRRVVTRPCNDHVTSADIDDMQQTLTTIGKVMAHLSRVRDVGQFYQLDPFLSENMEVCGHGTGSFSAWTQLAGFFVTGSDDFRDRVRRPENRLAFDDDALPLVDMVEVGAWPDLARRLNGPDAALHLQRVRDAYAQFHRVHQGAIRRHAPSSMAIPAPATPERTNAESIRAAIDSSRTGR